jgi:hypothetical protein
MHPGEAEETGVVFSTLRSVISAARVGEQSAVE